MGCHNRTAYGQVTRPAGGHQFRCAPDTVQVRPQSGEAPFCICDARWHGLGQSSLGVFCEEFAVTATSASGSPVPAPKFHYPLDSIAGRGRIGTISADDRRPALLACGPLRSPNRGGRADQAPVLLCDESTSPSLLPRTAISSGHQPCGGPAVSCQWLEISADRRLVRD